MRNKEGGTIVDEIDLELPDSFDTLISEVEHATDQHGRRVVRGIGSNLTESEAQRGVDLEILETRLEQGEQQPILKTFGKFNVAHLNTSSRLQAAQSSPAHNRHEEAPSNLLQALFEAGTEVDDQLRSAFQDVFSRPDEPIDITFDISGMTKLYLRVAEEFSDVPSNPREAGEVLTEYNTLDEEGDGYRSFVGVVLSLLLSEDRVVLLDEPEAFLHPAQARELGRWVAEHSTDTEGQIVIATHDADFIAGILSEDADVDIYRLNRSGERTVYNHISSDTTEKLASDPLLSSQRVLEAIFHKGVIVCEGGSDKAVYRSIAVNEIENDQLLFVNAHGMHNIKSITKVLKQARIPVAAIPDIDLLRSHHPMKHLLESVTDDDLQNILKTRREIEEAIQEIPDEEVVERMIPEVESFLNELENDEHTPDGAKAAVDRLNSEFSKWSIVKEEGLEGVPDEKHADVDRLIEDVKQYGVFIVPVGTLKGWMDLNRSSDSSWAVKALEVINPREEDEDSGDEYDYSDLTGFINEIEQYLENEYRRLIRP
jgi:hypothetical protein